MLHEEQYAKLARLTGLPNLATIVDPERLQRLVWAAQNQLATQTANCPLRYQVAAKHYAEAAAYRLEHPDEACKARAVGTNSAKPACPVV
jgi:hypothetical protein